MESHFDELVKSFLNCGKLSDKEDIFKDDLLAHHFSQQAQGKNVKRQFKRYKIVPTAFISFLKGTEIGQCDINWPARRITVSDLSELLKGCYKLTIIRECPWLHRAFL